MSDPNLSGKMMIITFLNVLLSRYFKIQTLHFLLLVVIVFAGNLSQASEPLPQTLKIAQVANGTLFHVQAHQAALPDVLLRMAKITQANFHYFEIPENLKVSGDCVSSQLTDVFTCLLGMPQNMVVRYSAQGRAEEVWILKIEYDANGNQNTGLSILSEGDVNFNDDTDAFVILTSSTDKVKRRNAMRDLGSGAWNADPALAKKILTESLSDDLPGIRAKAIATLAKIDADNARPQLIKMLNDESVDVRMAVIEAGYADVAILNKAQSNNIQEVVDYASYWLSKLPK